MSVSESAQSQTTSSSSGPDRTPGLFRIVWRWHFYAGLLMAPFLMTLALTGGLYLFSAEIEQYLQRDLLYVHEGSERQAIPLVMDAAQERWPQREISSILVSPESDRSIRVTMTVPEAGSESTGSPADEQVVFVDPWTAQVMGSMDWEGDSVHQLFHVVLDIHRHLFIGTTGRVIVELATSWGLLLLCTGLYLWWPRRKEKVRGVWWPRWNSKFYVLLRDLHAVAGVYLLPVILIMVSTGLFYTLVWGTAAFSISMVTNAGIEGLQAAAAGEQPKADEPQDDASPEPAAAEPAHVQAAYELAASEFPGRFLNIRVGDSTANAVHIGAFNDYARGTWGRMRTSQLTIDPGTRTFTDRQHLIDHPGYWWHTWIYPLHVGSVAGLASKLLWLAGCVVMFCLPLTGVWMWWKRRPAGRTGFPRRPQQSLPLWLKLLIMVICVLLPLAGLSLVVILLADRILSLRHTEK